MAAAWSSKGVDSSSLEKFTCGLNHDQPGFPIVHRPTGELTQQLDVLQNHSPSSLSQA